MSNEKNTKRTKTMYVPDQEVLAYSKAKKNNESVEEDLFGINDPIVFDEPILEEPSSAEISADEPELEVVNPPKKRDRSVKKLKFDFKKISFKDFFKIIFPQKSDSKKSIIIKCVAIFSAIAIVVSSVYLVYYFTDLNIQDTQIENEQNNYDKVSSELGNTRNEDNQFAKFDFIKAFNSDVVGWMTIPNTDVNNPVFQTDDNLYYVDYDMYKQKNSYGALFLDYRCNIDPKALTRNQIIYGHNMRFGAMFGTLREYRNIDFYKNNPLVMFDSLYEQRVYKIFAIMVVNDTEDSTFGYTYTAYRTDFATDTDFMDWIEQSRARSLYDIPVDVNSEDEIITMSTCCYDYDNARLVVLGRLVRDGESNSVNTDYAIKNADVIFSKAYYDKKGMKVPVLPSTESTTSETKK